MRSSRGLGGAGDAEPTPGATRATTTTGRRPEDLTFKLVDIVSKGGNYLLNVGPTAEGLIPQPSQDNLRAVGRWLKVNGESIYGAGPTPFGEELGAQRNGKGQEGQSGLQRQDRLALHDQARQALYPSVQVAGGYLSSCVLSRMSWCEPRCLPIPPTSNCP